MSRRASVPIGYTALNDTVRTALPMIEDVNADGKIRTLDVSIASMAYGSRPKDANWNLLADITQPYGVIDILDIVMITRVYGTIY